MWSSNFFADVLFDWENEINKRTEVTFFSIASVKTEQLQSDKRLPLRSSAAQSYEASSPKQRASGRELSLCLLSPNSTNSERNICSIRKRDWQTTVKLVVGTFQVPLSTTTTKIDLENQPSKTSQQSINVLEISLSLTPALPSISSPFVRSNVTHWLPAHQQICLHIQATPQPIWGIKN